MQEDLLQFIWQYNLYRPGSLKTTDGKALQVLNSGSLNRDSGPDFSMARIRLEHMTLIGNVELHVRSSDWLRHHHDHDPAYRKVILHVVFQHDLHLLPGDIPILELKEHIPAEVLHRYTNLIQTTAVLPCASRLKLVPGIVRSSWLSRMLVERWEGKLNQWEQELQIASGDWQSLLYRRMAASFGFKVNTNPFLLLARSLPLRILLQQNQLFQTEALLFGQAGFLAGSFTDEYPIALQKEYQYLRKKYGLEPIDIALWKFLRMRPANFPTIRIAQFASLLRRSPNLFTSISNHEPVQRINRYLGVEASSYWNLHYRFDEIQKRSFVKKMGPDTINAIIVNTIAPIRFLYAHSHHDSPGYEAALALLDALPSESNRITRMWEEYGWQAENASQSQAQIELYNNYCSRKRCLDCAIGLNIIKSRPDK